ncbi:MAG: glycosyltransferase [Nitrospira sp.]|nr:glycosyltransferase [Nitrospira sp.]
MISVIVPVWNAARFLPQVLDALEAQDFPPNEYEILLVDNGSSDESVTVINRYKKVRLLHEARRGAYAARNRAAVEATGDILAFTDADRVLDKGWLRSILDGFSTSDADVLLGRSRPADDSGLVALLADYENEKAAYVCQLGTSRQQYAYTGNMAVRRRAWERYGPFVELQRGADTVFVRRIVDCEPHGCVRYCERMADRHLELCTSLDYFRKVSLYGSSILTYSRVIPVLPLTVDDQIRILLRCAHHNHYSLWRTLWLGTGLLIGWVSYKSGAWRRRLEAGPLPVLPDSSLPTRDAQPSTHLSIVVEWENAVLAGDERGRGALRRLAHEVRTLEKHRRIEVIVVYYPGDVDPVPLERLVSDAFPQGMARLLAYDSGDYYELKNAGAKAATGDIVVFSDSDTHVEEGWLRQLVDPFSDLRIAAVAGSSYIEPSTLLGKAFGAFWFFPSRAKNARLEPAKEIFANNFAVRRDIFAKLPFQPLPGTNRGACVRWRERMSEANLAVVQNPLARTAHPPPNGGTHFFVRALTHGRDAIFLARDQGRTLESSAFGTLLRLMLNFARTTINPWTRRADLGLRPWEITPILLIGYVYYGTYFAGEVLTFLRPEWMSRRFRV